MKMEGDIVATGADTDTDMADIELGTPTSTLSQATALSQITAGFLLRCRSPWRLLRAFRPRFKRRGSCHESSGSTPQTQSEF